MVRGIRRETVRLIIKGVLLCFGFCQRFIKASARAGEIKDGGLLDGFVSRDGDVLDVNEIRGRSNRESGGAVYERAEEAANAHGELVLDEFPRSVNFIERLHGLRAHDAHVVADS